MITIKTEDEIKIMRETGKILASVLKEIEKQVKPGITTLELDRATEALILKYGAKPSFKGYDGFPYSLCASVNENIVHGFPSDYILKEGDIIGLDLGVSYGGYNADMAVTVPVGKVSFEAKRLVDVTKKSLRLAIKKVKVGNSVGDIGNTIQRFVEGQGFGVVRDLCGHGIGKNVHEDPKIPNFGKRHKGEELKEGMVIAIEVIYNLGKPDIESKFTDRWTLVTKDSSISGLFEHTVAVTSNDPVILT